MALTTNYKNNRVSRSITKHSAYNKGVYASNQSIPEGFVRALVNYRINELGDSFYPRPGRELIAQVESLITVDQGQTYDYKKGPLHITGYLYHKDTSNDDNMKVYDTQLMLNIG